MNTNILSLLSNLIYLICGVILITKKKILFGILIIIMWLISHMYHSDRDNFFWNNLDMVCATLGLIFILIKYYKHIFNSKNIIYLFILALFYILARKCDNENNIQMYNICHSFWHITSAIFVTYIIINN
jgi:hypothetical protein